MYIVLLTKFHLHSVHPHKIDTYMNQKKYALIHMYKVAVIYTLDNAILETYNI